MPASPPSDLSFFLDEELYPALWERLDSAFPEFGFVLRGDHWQATHETATRALPGAPRPDRVWAYRDTPFGIKIHGGGFVPWLEYAAGQSSLRGEAFLNAVRDLCLRAGVSFPERERSPQALQAAAERHRKADLLEAFTACAAELLHTEQGEEARHYLEGRGFTVQQMRDFELGCYPGPEEVLRALTDQGYGVEEVREAGLAPGAFDSGQSVLHLWPGRIVGPWRDRAGRIVNVWSRAITPGEPGKKYLMLRGGSRASPFGLHNARGRDLVLVEGILDVLSLRAAGVENVVGLGGAGLGSEQVEALARSGVRSLTLNLDYDPSPEPCVEHQEPACPHCYPGLLGTLQAIEKLGAAVPEVYVVPPVCMADNGNVDAKVDPDSYLRRAGADAYRELLRQAVRGPVFAASCILERADLSCVMGRDRAVSELLDLAARTVDPRDREAVWRIAAERCGYSEACLAELAQRRMKEREQARRRRELAGILEAARRQMQEQPPGIVAATVGERLARFGLDDTLHSPTLCIDEVLESIRTASEGRRSGWGALDDLGVRFHPAELTIIGARTGHGKTTVLLGLLLNWLARYKQDRFCFFSYELPPEAVVLKLASCLTRRNGGRGWTYYEIRDWLQGTERVQGYPAAAELEQALDQLRQDQDRLHVIYRPEWSVSELFAAALQVGQRGPVGGVLVDYLQLVPPPAGQYDRRDIEVSQVARRLKALAVELACPVVAAAQIGRQAAQQGERIPDGEFDSRGVQEAIRKRRPQLHHLREGGSEQEADLVLGLLNYRADYLEDREDVAGGERDRPGPLEILVLKNRYGQMGLARLTLEGRCGLIRDMQVGDEGQ
ncbi:MAG: toprim domain-containing protein [Armatimonadetes bacterium]|nr:toprim domain-containing protein [Armatimonadota bacterium]